MRYYGDYKQAYVMQIILEHHSAKIDWSYCDGKESLLEKSFDVLGEYPDYLVKQSRIHLDSLDTLITNVYQQRTTIANVMIYSIANMIDHDVQEDDETVLKSIDKYIDKVDLNERLKIFGKNQTVFSHLLTHLREQDVITLVRSHPDAFLNVNYAIAGAIAGKPRTRPIMEEIMKLRQAPFDRPVIATPPTKKLSDFSLFHLTSRASDDMQSVSALREKFERNKHKK